MDYAACAAATRAVEMTSKLDIDYQQIGCLAVNLPRCALFSANTAVKLVVGQPYSQLKSSSGYVVIWPYVRCDLILILRCLERLLNVCNRAIGYDIKSENGCDDLLLHNVAKVVCCTTFSVLRLTLITS